jgi:hypothetical protein
MEQVTTSAQLRSVWERGANRVPKNFEIYFCLK